MPLMNTYARFPVSFSKGEGVYLFTENNKKYLDLVSGIGVNSLGYNHPIIINAFQNAIKKPLHVSNLYEIPQQNELAKTLLKDSPFHQTFFCNSGTEANEGALKLVRKFQEISGNTQKNTIISFNHSFHGRTMGSLTITGKESIKTGFTPLIGNTKILEWNDSEELKNYLEKYGHTVAAIFMEPIQGEGGINLPNADFIKTINTVCSQHNIVLVVDEVQTGLGRTGKKFAFEHFGLNADVITLAKGMGGGVPIGAILAKENIAKAFTPGTHGTTFGGNPLVCTVAHSVCTEILEKKFLKHVQDTSENIFENIEILMQEFPTILLQQKGRGLMIGIEINSAENRNLLVNELLKKHILTVASGEKTLRLLPPLIIQNHELAIFWKALKEILQKI